MTWPTQAQLDQAQNHGIEYALEEIAKGGTQSQESPLNGEWADGLLPRDIADNVGYKEPALADGEYLDGCRELTDAWERGYFDQWMVHRDNQE